MYPGMFEAIADRGLFPPITWDVVVDSSAVGYAKPDEDMVFLLRFHGTATIGTKLFTQFTKH